MNKVRIRMISGLEFVIETDKSLEVLNDIVSNDDVLIIDKEQLIINAKNIEVIQVKETK